jgi:arylsulfatase A-like enzyme
MLRRDFLKVAGAALGISSAQGLTRIIPQHAAHNTTAWSPPSQCNNPNILLIMVDQLRFPMWLTAGQATEWRNHFAPNIAGRLLGCGYTFPQRTAATVCTAARGTLITGLYAPQTAIYSRGESIGDPALNPGFPTWGYALAQVNPAYQNNVWWFGKWHLANCTTVSPLLIYGYQTRTYPGGVPDPYIFGDPVGGPNEGCHGGLYNNRVFASDAMITSDFLEWLQGNPAGPWCATVSLINPHDISEAPKAFFKPSDGRYFPPDIFPAPGLLPLLDSLPSPWNWEDLQSLQGIKPQLQLVFQSSQEKTQGAVTDWAEFLNWYYWLQCYVDYQIGYVLDALAASPFAENTVIIFTSDHGEFGGSHGLHDKGCAVYSESMQVPLAVVFPGQSKAINMPQRASSVDLFRLILELGTSGASWQDTYPDQINSGRESIYSFIYSNSLPTRVGPVTGLPYNLFTSDSLTQGILNAGPLPPCHIASVTTDAAKYAVYSTWTDCSFLPEPDAPQQFEFYDYLAGNTAEIGNDYFSSDPAVQADLSGYQQELGQWGNPDTGMPATGLIATQLNAPLVGTGTDGTSLADVQLAARQQYFQCQA